MTELLRDHAVPLYEQLTELLLKEISSGAWTPGTRLPSTREIENRWNVSSITARRALDEVTRRGFAYSVQGKGTFVAEPRVDMHLYRLAGFSEDMRRRNLTPSSRVLKTLILYATAKLAEIMEIPLRTRLYQINRLRLADGAPMCVQEAYIPVNLCPDLLAHDLEHESLYAIALNEYGLEIVDNKVSIRARLATQQENQLLNLQAPSAILEAETIAYIPSGKVFEYAKSSYRGDRYELYTIFSKYGVQPD